MAPADLFAFAALLAGFFFGVGMVLRGLFRPDNDAGGWGGPDDEPEPEPLPGPSGRELVGAVQPRKQLTTAQAGAPAAPSRSQARRAD